MGKLQIFLCRSWVIYGGQAVIIFAVLWLGLHLNIHNIEIPLSAKGDALHHLAITKAIIESGWWWHISRLSAPFGLDMVIFPVGGTLDYALIKFLSYWSDKPGVVLNSFWILSCVLTGIGATWSLRRLDISGPVSFSVGLLFAFLPHAFYRNLNHLMLVYYLVPLTSAFAILILKGDFQGLPRRDKIILYLGCVAVGLNYVYTAFFSCFVLAVVIAVGFITKDWRRILYPAGCGLAIITVVTFLTLSPSLFAWHKDHEAQRNVAQKAMADADTYGLKLRHLLTPIPGHPLALWRRFEAKTSAANFPLETENAAERLGTLGSIGFLILLGVSLFGPFRRQQQSWVGANLRPLASLNLAVFLLVTIGGFGSIFNLLVSSEIRALNRAATFTAFFSIAAISVLLACLEKKTVNTRRARAVFLLCLPIFIVAGILDEAPFGLLRKMHHESGEAYLTLQPFVQMLEKELPKNSMVFQLPYAPYPNSPKIHQMSPHQHLLPYVLSSYVKWSWPSLSGRAMKVTRKLANDRARDFVKNLAIAGYDGVWIDRLGYEDEGKTVIHRLTIEAGGTTLVSSDSRYAFVSLRALKEKLSAEIPQAKLEEQRFKLLHPTPSRVMDRPLPESNFKALIDVENAPSLMIAGQTRSITVTVKNLGTSVFSSTGDPSGRYAVAVAYRWLSDTKVEADYGPRTFFPDDLRPNDQITIAMSVKAPKAPGDYVLEVDLVQEMVAWFQDKGSKSARVAIRVLR